MAGGGLTPTATRDGAWTRIAGRFWRAVAAGSDPATLDGTVRAGRYNRAGERTLYMSASLEGVTAAMARYGKAERVVIALHVEADRLIDLRDPVACAAHGIDAGRVAEDWIAALDGGDEPPSWAVADRARSVGATGLIDGSRRATGAWHVVLFAWGQARGAQVVAISD